MAPAERRPPPADREPGFATIARGMGCFGIGPISEPAAIRPALEAAIREVKAGKPALVDVVTQHR